MNILKSYYDSEGFQEQLNRLKVLNTQAHSEVVNTYKSKGETPKVSDESIVDMLDIQNGIDDYQQSTHTKLMALLRKRSLKLYVI